MAAVVVLTESWKGGKKVDRVGSQEKTTLL